MNPHINDINDITTTGSEASEVGADYTNLASMLIERNFKSADKETARLMLWATRRESLGRLKKDDIENFPCRDLHTINQLWLASSNRKYGFSVQKQVWVECRRDMLKFYERLEWKKPETFWKRGEFFRYDDLYWDLRGLKVVGHLPRVLKHVAESQRAFGGTPEFGLGWPKIDYFYTSLFSRSDL